MDFEGFHLSNRVILHMIVSIHVIIENRLIGLFRYQVHCKMLIKKKFILKFLKNRGILKRKSNTLF